MVQSQVSFLFVSGLFCHNCENLGIVELAIYKLTMRRELVHWLFPPSVYILKYKLVISLHIKVMCHICHVSLKCL